MPVSKQPVDMVAVALFAVAGALIGIAFSIIYIGVNYLSVLGAEWHWIWE